MRKVLGFVLGAVLSVAAMAAVTITESQRVTLLRGSSSQSTAACPLGVCPSRAVCKAEQRRLAEESAATSGQAQYFCQNERDVLTAVYRPNPPPPVDCVVDAWSAWSGGEWQPAQCPSSGVQTREETRTRSVLVQPANGGLACPALSETRTASQACTPPPVDCVVSAPVTTTGTWSACQNGSRTRTDTLTRTVIAQPAFGGAACPLLVTTEVVTEACVVSPPPSTAIFRDDFNYTVNRTDSSKAAAFTARGWYVKDEATQPTRARGFLYTRSTAPGCGPSPDGSPFLTMEARPVTMGGQTDFYLGVTGRGGLTGRFPASFKLEFDMCMSRAGAEMSDLVGVHNKLFYTLYGPDGAQYPMNNANVASLISMSSSKWVGNQNISRPNPGDFTFRNYPQTGPNGERAVVAGQAPGTTAFLTSNTGDGFLRTNQWHRVRMTIDTSGPNGSYRVEVDRGAGFELIADYVHGQNGLTWNTAPLDRLGPLNLRIPTTTTLADFWLNLDNFSISAN